MIDAEHYAIVCAAFGMEPHTPAKDNPQDAPLFLVLLQIDLRFIWYAEHGEAPLLPNEKRDIARAISEAYASKGKP